MNTTASIMLTIAIVLMMGLFGLAGAALAFRHGRGERAETTPPLQAPDDDEEEND